MFLNCAEKSVDNTEIFLLLLSSVCIESRHFQLLVPPHQGGGRGAQGVEKDTAGAADTDRSER